MNILQSSARLEKEARRWRVDDIEDNVREIVVGTESTQQADTIEDFDIHITLGRVHAIEDRITFEHIRDHIQSTLLADPKARARRIDHGDRNDLNIYTLTHRYYFFVGA